MEERARSPDFHQNGYSEQEQYSDTFCSDDFENSCVSASPSAQKVFHSPSLRGEAINLHCSDSQVHHPGLRIFSKFPPNRRGFRLGNSRINRVPSQKDIDLLTKRVLSTRLLKINELQNEVNELQFKLDELLKENKALKRLQYKQEKALNKFEDTESEISQLVVRHNNEIKVLKERLRKSQEKERLTDKKIKDTESELVKTKSSLKKLRKISEAKHLPERDELAKKLVLAENKLDDTEKKIKELTKNLELNTSSYQRQLQTEKKRTHEAQEENKILQKELQRLYQKLREKERELEVRNIYSNRNQKKTPKRERDASPKKTASVGQKIKGIYSTKGVQTGEYCKEDELLSSLGFVSQGEHLNLEKLKFDEIKIPSTIEREEKFTKDFIKQKTEILQDDWAQDYLKDYQKENVFLKEKEKPTVDTTFCRIKNETNWKSKEKDEKEDGRKKDILFAKLNEIDKEIQSALHLSPCSKLLSSEKKSQSFRFSDTSDRLFNEFINQDSNYLSSNNDHQRKRDNWTPTSTSSFTFGSYVPSFGKATGRSIMFNDKNDISDLTSTQDSGDLSIKKDKKANLMEQLFGANATSTFSSKYATSNSLTNSKGDFDLLNVLPMDKSSRDKVQDEAPEDFCNYTDCKSLADADRGEVRRYFTM
ncbi:lebercilin isoform X1 [Macrotis lagotis]|uniref:lebercilin isoform X1 n=1 Tax=Macrotis lagotis TaxID=92651 RepID=UPI003D68923D